MAVGLIYKSANVLVIIIYLTKDPVKYSYRLDERKIFPHFCDACSPIYRFDLPLMAVAGFVRGRKYRFKLMDLEYVAALTPSPGSNFT